MKTLAFWVLASLCLVTPIFAQQNLTQTVRGTVIDKTVQTALPGATVILVTSSPVIATTADADGKFKLSNIPVGRHSFQVRMMGYKDFFLNNIEVSTGKENVLTVSMEEDMRQMNEVVVQGEKDKSKANNNLAVVSAINMRSAEINRFAGSRSDPSRMASNFAGVAGGNDQRNDILVRGNSPWGVLWRLEGVEIPNPNHFSSTGNTGGAFSILNNNLMANSDFLTGAFPAEYGNKTAAVFDIRLRKGNNEKRENAAQIGLNGLEFMTEGPFSKKGGSSYLASGRILSFEAMDAMGVKIGANGIPQYQDGTFKLDFPLKKGNISVWGIGGRSSIALKDEVDDITESYITQRNQTFASGMYAMGSSFTHHFGEKTMGVATISASGNSVKIDSKEKWSDKADEKSFRMDNIDAQYTAQYKLTHKWNARNQLKSGATYRLLRFNNTMKFFDRTEDAEITPLSQKGDARLFQAYSQWQFRASEKLTINPGVYFQHFSLGNVASVEPRLSVNYQLSDRDRISAATGLHSQTAPLFIYQFRFKNEGTGNYDQPNMNLGFSKSYQAVLGYQRNLGNNLNFKTETYYQYLYDVPVSISSDTGASTYSILNTGADYGFTAFDSTVAKGTGQNYGVEVSLEKSFGKGYYFLTNVSIFRSTYNGADGVSRSTAFDLGHVANLLVGKEFHLDKDNKRVLSVDIKLTSSGGRHYTPVDKEASIRDGKARYDYNQAFSPKLNDYFRTDLKITYSLNRPKANHNFFIAADNILNNQNILTKDWNSRKKQEETYYQLGIFPYLGYRVQF